MFLWNIAVTSLAEVWIEITKEKAKKVMEMCHFPCGSVDWNRERTGIWTWLLLSLPLRKCGLKSGSGWGKSSETSSLPLRKCGLKYCGNARSVKEDLVTSLAEVWIEIAVLRSLSYTSPVTSLAEVWIEICYIHFHHSGMQRHFPCGSVDWNA